MFCVIQFILCLAGFVGCLAGIILMILTFKEVWPCDILEALILILFAIVLCLCAVLFCVLGMVEVQV